MVSHKVLLGILCIICGISVGSGTVERVTIDPVRQQIMAAIYEGDVVSLRAGLVQQGDLLTKKLLDEYTEYALKRRQELSSFKYEKIFLTVSMVGVGIYAIVQAILESGLRKSIGNDRKKALYLLKETVLLKKSVSLKTNPDSKKFIPDFPQHIGEDIQGIEASLQESSAAYKDMAVRMNKNSLKGIISVTVGLGILFCELRYLIKKQRVKVQECIDVLKIFILQQPDHSVDMKATLLTNK